MLIHAFILFLYIIFKVLSIITSRKKVVVRTNDPSYEPRVIRPGVITPKKSIFTKIIGHFEFKILVTAFLIFIIECLVFILYDFYCGRYGHWFFVLSLVLAIVYLLILLGCLFLDIIGPLK